MAAHQSPRSSNQERAKESAKASAAVVPSATEPASARKWAVTGADLQDMVLLREKLTQIAVGRRHNSDNQLDHMEDSGDEDDCGAARRRRPARDSSQFRMFLPPNERPSTPPSSPQPRDVLRKHLRMKSHTPFYCAPQRSLSLEDNNSDTASDEPLDGMCVDAIEISPLPHSAADYGHALPTRATVRLSVPDHLRVRTASSSSSYSMLTKCPEGFRKRKSVHIDDKDLLIDGQSVVAPLKKVSSQVNVLGNLTPVTSSTSHVQATACDHEMEDVGPDPSDSPTDDGSSCS